MKTILDIVRNENGHGGVPSGKDVLKIIGGILIAPIALPIVIIKDKIKKYKERKGK